MKRIASVALLGILAAVSAAAQTPSASTSSIVGTVRDPSGAAIAGADVVLTDLTTNRMFRAQSNEQGRYTVANLPPGSYKMTVSTQGFQQAVVPEVKAEAAKTYTVDVALQVGDVTTTVEVSASSVELQQVDATVSTTLNSEIVLRLPNPTRDITAIQFIQPLTMPGGQVAGARGDQNTYLLDGADITDNVVGTNFLEPVPSPNVPLPAESVEEFRVGTNNPNGTFGRSSGGQLVLVTKRGGNALHGSLYWYHQNDNLNASSWTLNRNAIAKPELKDNRFGFSLGGPIIKDRTFFFMNYEGRRFPRGEDISRIVPTATLRSGILQFRDTAGNVQSFDLTTFDPRGIGLNPVIQDVWALLPQGNDPSQGDGLNTIGFTGVADTSIHNDVGVLRLDHTFSDRWRFDSSLRYARTDETGNAQVDIGGVLPGHTLGTPAGTEVLPRRPRLFSGALTGNPTNNITNELRFGYVRAFLGFTRVAPVSPVPTANIALDVATTLLAEPVDVSTGNSRSQQSNSKTFQITDNLTWSKQSHTMSFGGTYRRIFWFFERNDKLVGPISAPIATIDAGSFVTVPAANRPQTCSAMITTNCLRSADVTTWNRLYAGALGMIDNVGVLIARDENLQPLPLGTPLRVDTAQSAYDIYFNDTWRVSSSLTLSLGATYQWQTSPKEKDDLQAFLIDNATNEILTSDLYLRRAREAAEAGGAYDPTLAFLPLRASGRDNYFDTDWSNFGPRLAAAWNPSFQNGWLGRIFGDKKSVFRGGYALVYDRQNSINVVSWNVGVGFGQTLSFNGPLCDAQGSPGAGCNPAGTSPTSAFRIGVDGLAPAPAIPAVTDRVIPSTPFGEVISRHIDPNNRVGRSHSLDFTIQRELPGDMLFETGWVVRFARELNQGYAMSSVPYFHLDTASGQTFAQAFDAIAAELRSGVAGASVTPQPWFENQVGAGRTVSFATSRTSDFVTGNVSTLWLNLNTTMTGLGIPALSNQQVQTLWSRGDGGRSYFSAFFFTLRKRYRQGLNYTLNYTISQTLDQVGVNQNSSTAFSNAFFPDLDYGPASFDRRHVMNATWLYDLPFGRGRFAVPNSTLEKIVGGWYLSGIFTANSGVPLSVTQSSQAFGGGLQFTTATGAIPTVDPSGFGNSLHTNVPGSGGIGTNGDPANGGTGLNIFADPETVYNIFRRVSLSQDGRQGRGVLRGLPHWNLDASIGKRTSLSEQLRLIFTFDFLNLFNHVQRSNPSLNLSSPANFGVITGQSNDPRAIQFGLRFEF